MNSPDDLERAIAELIGSNSEHVRLPVRSHPDDYGRPQPREPDSLNEIARLLRSLPAEELWRFCNVMKRPELDKVLVAAAIAILEGKEFDEPAKIERRL